MKSVTTKIDWRRFRVSEPEALGLPRPRRTGIYSFGPRELHLRETVIYGGGPEEFVRNNPQLFARGTTSRDEGYFYWALVHLIGVEGEVGLNGMTWYYQSKVAGGFTRAGGSVVDFIVQHLGRNKDLGIRIVTVRFHFTAGPLKRATDYEQTAALEQSNIQPVDVDSRLYVSDISGRAVLAVAAKAILGYGTFGTLYQPFQGLS